MLRRTAALVADPPTGIKTGRAQGRRHATGAPETLREVVTNATAVTLPPMVETIVLAGVEITASEARPDVEAAADHLTDSTNLSQARNG